MIKKIAYENKVAIQNDEEIARKNKVTDADLNEIKEVVNNNADELENKISKQEGKGLSEEDFTTELKTKLNNLENYDDTEVKQDILNLDTSKASKAELQEATIALQAELKATRKDYEAGTLEGQAEGESLYLQDSSNARFREFGIGGNSEQEKREGYNKLYLDILKTGSINGVDYSIEGNKITLNGTTTQETDIYFVGSWGGTENPEKRKLTAGTYTMILKGPQKGNRFAVKMYCGTKEVMVLERVNTNNYVQKIITEETYMSNIYITISGNMKLNNETFEIMVLEGEYTDQTAPEYEDYGAMPSLEFLSEIEAVGQDVNIFDKNSATKGIMFTATDEVQNDKYFSSDYIKVKKNTDYCTNEYAPVIKAFDADKNQIGYLRNVATAGTFNTENAEYIKARNSIQFETEEQMQNAIDNAKIIEGTEINGYSPYGCGSANVTVCNKNTLGFVDFTHIENGITVDCKDNKMHISGTATKGFSIFLTRYCNIKEINKIILNKKITLSSVVSAGIELNVGVSGNSYYMQLKGNTKTVTKVIDKEISTIYLYIPNNTTINQDLNIQLELDNATDYIAHEEQTFTMPVQQEMLEGDEFDWDNEEEVHTWSKVELTGNETGWFKSSTTMTNAYGIKNEKIGLPVLTENTSKCTHFKYADGVTATSTSKYISQLENLYLSFPLDIAKTLEEFKSLMQEQTDAGTPVTIYYKLAEPTKLPFTEVQKTVAKQIREKLHSYKGGTHVYCTDELSPIFNTRYTVDMQTAFNAINKEVINNV